jgi:hypothetical protein
MAIATQKFVRKPLYVDAVQITLENFVEIAKWCHGEIRDYNDKPLVGAEAENATIERYIHVRVHNPKNVRQQKAFIGDWLLYTDRGYKVYTPKAFKGSFDEVPTEPGDSGQGEVSQIA